MKTKPSHILFTGLHGSARALTLSTICKDRPTLIVMDNADEALYLFKDLQALEQGARTKDKGQSSIVFFPTSKRRRQGTDEAMRIQRTEVLNALLEQGVRNKDKGQSSLVISHSSITIVTYPEALVEPTPLPKTLTGNTINLHVGQTIAMSAIKEQLFEQAFTKVDFVYEPGQFAIRGGIMDIYSYSHELPYRLDFFGDEIDSIREFDIETQLSKEKVESVAISPALDDNNDTGFITDYLAKDTLWISNDWSLVKFKVESLEFRVVTPNGDSLELDSYLDDKDTIEINQKSFFPTYDKREFHTIPQPPFHKNFDLLAEDIHAKQEAGYTIYILAEQQKQLDRLRSILESLAAADVSSAEDDPSGEAGLSAQRSFSVSGLNFVLQSLHTGFVDEDNKVAYYTDHEIFERFHRVTLRSEEARRGKAILTLKEINQLRLGDYVVHSDHGIGTFGGLITTTVNGKPQEMIRILYRDEDTIFVSIHNLHRISKYKGKEGSAPTISKLGSGAWERLKERTKDKVKDIARDLIALYATRKRQQGFAYTPDGYMQHELEASFLYEDTVDQAKATLDVKRDMESPQPMDRLVCGDVGFGKTEVAMRAAFKAATDGKQVAVLVPTTVLALQHYNTFKDRFKNFPVRIEYLSRGKSPKQAAEVLADLKSGKIDILIGTHKLVGKQVQWHDLGLLIIDEEQKFGVAVKEKLKSLRTNVDVLTLTATPIPRTLQFSLLGARDLSIINTPPQNRYPIQTEVITPEDEDIIKEALTLELERNGQVFVVNNRIEMLPRIEHRIHQLCPEARIVVAHGQMPSDEMEEKLEAFINYDYDILISTTIIESGVDIPNVNTMIIYSAQHYGLADLHQLRGRVGRSNRKAYCYLVAPEKELLTEDARRRLNAITTFADLGSGFNLAMQDLDIRGAGNMLGAEQSGFIADLGYDTYQRILNEAVEELRDEWKVTEESENSQLSPLGATTLNSKLYTLNWCNDSQLESDLPLCFPNTYIENISERITLYKELDSLNNEDELLAFEKRLIDRFGALPEEAQELLNVVRLRWLCCEMGIEKIFLKQEQMTLYFVTNRETYWQSETFGKILQYAVHKTERCQLKEEVNRQGVKTGKRYLTIQQVKTLAGAIHLLTKILND
ncbi:MAG: transcription-repair coupling factor [Paludibacteraceae bacterium]|nr:transcription-repair coupling factor [Paludibacteraceae bacterium]